MAAVGADVEQLRKAAQTFRQKAEYLESTITQGISRQITESPGKVPTPTAPKPVAIGPRPESPSGC